MPLSWRVAFIALWITALGGPAAADVIADWNEKAVAAGTAARQPTAAHTRSLAMVHLAMFEAVNSIEPRYAPYQTRLSPAPGTSREAAAAAAAHSLLVRMYPEQAEDLGKALQASLGPLPDGPAKTQGIRLGEQAAAAMLAYRPFTTAGVYVPTVLPVASTWGAVRPFGLRSGSQVRPAAPYALTSREWARDYNEVKTMGAKTGSARSAEQTDIARFWELTGAATYNPLVRQLSEAKGLDVIDNARLFALVAMATADAYIAIFDAKYAYNFWRPVTAIRNGDLDGNDATERDPAWEPIISTPLHPEYPCAHCIIQGSAARVLETLFGDAIPAVALTSRTAPGVTRRFVKLSDYVAEVIDARVYDGVHYRTSGDVGAAMGRKIGEHVLDTRLRRIR
jgi:hypothetical protein